MRIACHIPKATNTQSEYVILNAFPLQQWLQDRAFLLHYPHIACLLEVIFLFPNYVKVRRQNGTCAIHLQHFVILYH